MSRNMNDPDRILDQALEEIFGFAGASHVGGAGEGHPLLGRLDALLGQGRRFAEADHFAVGFADPQGDAGRNARWYLERIGTPAEDAALASYLDSERRRT